MFDEMQRIDDDIDLDNNEYMELDYLNKLREISPLVDEYFLNNMYYRECGCDNYTINDLLLIAFDIILNELQDIGIYIDGSSYLGDYVSMEKVYEFRRVFDPVIFRTTLVNTPELHNELQVYIDTIMSEPDEELMTDVLSDVLEIMSTICVSNNTVYKILYSCSTDNITCTKDFIPYIVSALEDSVYLNKSQQFGDVETTTQYIQKIHKGRIYFNTALSFLLTKFNVPRTETIAYITRMYDLDKIQPDVVKFFAYLDDDSKSIDDFPEVAQKLYNEYIINRHHKNSHHHYEYWESRGIQVTDPGIIAVLVAHHYTPDKSVEMLVQDIEPLQSIMDNESYILALRMARSLATM